MGANNESNLQSKAAVAADALSRSSTCLHSQKNASGLIAAAVHVLSFFLSTANVPYPSGCTFPFASTLKQCRQLGVTCLCCALWVQNIVATAGSGTPWLLPLLLPLLIGEKDQLTEDAEEQKIAPKNAKGHNLLTEEHTPCRRRRCCCCCCWFWLRGWGSKDLTAADTPPDAFLDPPEAWIRSGVDRATAGEDTVVAGGGLGGTTGATVGQGTLVGGAGAT
mmetsp:Transcript_9555/g.24402  ORF Transcript_9555/g.24402 Transcript_9555/m.24402 type:complete len:221 (-) Transcript_9555:130-792(-)